MQLDSSSITGLVDRLIREGLVERREDPSDRRSIQVWLTAKGRQIANQAFVIAQDFNLHMSGNQDEEVLAKWEKQLSELEFRASQHLKAADELTE